MRQRWYLPSSALLGLRRGVSMSTVEEIAEQFVQLGREVEAAPGERCP